VGDAATAASGAQDGAHNTDVRVVPAKRNDPGLAGPADGGDDLAHNADVPVVPAKRNDPDRALAGAAAPPHAQIVPHAWNDLDDPVVEDRDGTPATPDGTPAMPDGAAEGAAHGTKTKPRWSDVAVLYRKHKHREAIVARLREEDIPYTVVGGLSLFGTPEIRDLEQSLRAIADPHNDVALVRMLSAGPWRLDALEILEVSRMARFDRRHLADVIREIVGTGVVLVDRLAGGNGNGNGEDTRKAEEAVDPATRAKLRRLIDTLEELTPLTWREGPFTILERYVERTGQVLDLIAADSLEA
jgi:hypothetical protein